MVVILRRDSGLSHERCASRFVERAGEARVAKPVRTTVAEYYLCIEYYVNHGKQSDKNDFTFK